MNKLSTELFVGLFMVIGFLCFGLVVVKFGNDTWVQPHGYELKASFASVSGLKVGAPVEIAGVEVGEVISIDLEMGRAVVRLWVRDSVKVGDDTIASVRTKGLIGEKYMKLVLGISDDYLEPNDEIVDTEPVMDIEDLIGKFIYEK